MLLLSLPTATSDRQCLYCHKQLTKFGSLVAYQQFHTYSICKLTVTGHFGDVYIYIDLRQLKLLEATVISCSQSTTHLLLYEWSRMGIGDTRRRRSWVKWFERRSTRCERCTYSEGFVHILYRSKEQAYGGSCGGVQVPHHMSSLPDSCSTP